MILAGVIAWQVLRDREPVYQGKSLSQWLEKYDRVEDIGKTLPIDEAIRAVGTSGLPYIIRSYLRHTDSGKITRLTEQFERLPILKKLFYNADQNKAREIRRFSRAMLALKALGSGAEPLIPEFQRLLEYQETRYKALMGLYCMGPVSIPALQEACRNTNAWVRANAALILNKMRAGRWAEFPRDEGYGTGLRLGYGSSSDDCGWMVENLESPDPAIRRANIDALRFFGASYTNGVPALVKALEDGDGGVAHAASEALKAIDPAAAALAGVQ
jgi:hypothetical protein